MVPLFSEGHFPPVAEYGPNANRAGCRLRQFTELGLQLGMASKSEKKPQTASTGRRIVTGSTLSSNQVTGGSSFSCLAERLERTVRLGLAAWVVWAATMDRPRTLACPAMVAALDPAGLADHPVPDRRAGRGLDAGRSVARTATLRGLAALSFESCSRFRSRLRR
jgi:hypothetical protein